MGKYSKCHILSTLLSKHCQLSQNYFNDTPTSMYIIFVCGYQSYKASLTAECTVKGFSQISRKNTLISSGGWKSECEAGGECTQPLWMSPESKGNFCFSHMFGTTWLQTSDVSTQSYFWDFPEDINFHIFSTYQVLLSSLLSNIKYLEDKGGSCGVQDVIV